MTRLKYYCIPYEPCHKKTVLNKQNWVGVDVNQELKFFGKFKKKIGGGGGGSGGVGGGGLGGQDGCERRTEVLVKIQKKKKKFFGGGGGVGGRGRVGGVRVEVNEELKFL